MAGNRFAVLLLSTFVLSVQVAAALEIVSAVPVKTDSGKRADFVFAGSVTVRGVSFDKNAVIMPVSEHRGRTYADIRIFSKALYKKMEACFFKKKCSAGGRVASPRISVLGRAPLRSDIRIANIFLSFDGDLSVTFGAIKKASGEIWASYPDNFEVSDADLRSLINAKVAEAAREPLSADKKGDESISGEN